MRHVSRQLQARMRDILAYVRMLQFIEQTGGVVWLQGRQANRLELPAGTVHVLKAGVFLHLYNLVEATVTNGLECVAESITTTGMKFADLNSPWQRAWAASYAKFDDELSSENKLVAALNMCHAVARGMVMEIKPRIGVGNLDDRRIEDLAKRYGIALVLRPTVTRSVKHQVLNDLGFLGLVRERRNGLAHGRDSFADTGRNYSTNDLARWSWATYQYLKDLLRSFELYVSEEKFRRGN